MRSQSRRFVGQIGRFGSQEASGAGGDIGRAEISSRLGRPTRYPADLLESLAQLDIAQLDGGRDAYSRCLRPVQQGPCRLIGKGARQPLVLLHTLGGAQLARRKCFAHRSILAHSLCSGCTKKTPLTAGSQRRLVLKKGSVLAPSDSSCQLRWQEESLGAF